MNVDKDIPEKKFFRSHEVARLLDCSQRTVQRRMAAGAFGEIHIDGGIKRIARQGLLEYFNRHMTDDFS